MYNIDRVREHGATDACGGNADPIVVSLELLTALGTRPIAAFIVY